MATSEASKDSEPKSPQASNETCSCVPQQLVDAQELLKVLNSKLEDCALERQATISCDQWKIFNSKSPGDNTADHSLLARTYFANKDHDQAFQHLISCNKIFSECLANLIALLHGEEPILSMKQTRDVHSQWTNSTLGDQISNDLMLESHGINSLMHQHPLEAKYDSNVIRNALNLRHTFADVIKAKVNFDTKFLGFEAVLHNAASCAPATEGCICRFATNVARTKTTRRTGLRITSSSRKNAKKRKRLARSRRTVIKSRRGKKSDEKKNPAKDIGDHAQITVN